jgi:hypothetical protein
MAVVQNAVEHGADGGRVAQHFEEYETCVGLAK